MVLSPCPAASSTLTARASSCSDSTISGTYAFTLHGTIFLPDGSTLLIDGIAKQTYDGKGNMSQVDAVATNGFLTPGWRAGTGTYSVNSDCTGTLTITIPGLSDLHLQFIVAQSGNTIHQVVTDPGVATTGEGVTELRAQIEAAAARNNESESYPAGPKLFCQLPASFERETEPLLISERRYCAITSGMARI